MGPLPLPRPSRASVLLLCVRMWVAAASDSLAPTPPLPTQTLLLSSAWHNRQLHTRPVCAEPTPYPSLSHTLSPPPPPSFSFFFSGIFLQLPIDLPVCLTLSSRSYCTCRCIDHINCALLQKLHTHSCTYQGRMGACQSLLSLSIYLSAASLGRSLADYLLCNDESIDVTDDSPWHPPLNGTPSPPPLAPHSQSIQIMLAFRFTLDFLLDV